MSTCSDELRKNRCVMLFNEWDGSYLMRHVVVLSLAVLVAISVSQAAGEGSTYSKGEISFDFPQYFTKSMFHCFNIEELCEKAPKVDRSAVTVTVTDKDADRFPGSIDEVPVFVWSDTDAKGMMVIAHETHINSGVFVGTFGITDSTSYKNKIQVRDGGALLAKYVDDTVPGGKGEDLTTTSFIGMLGIPVERAPAYNLHILDNNGNKIEAAGVDQQILITSELKNSASKSQNFSYILQIHNEKEESVLLSWVDGMLVAKQHIEPAISWMPKAPGKYTATVFVWESLQNPTALSPPVQVDIDVSETKQSVTEQSSDVDDSGSQYRREIEVLSISPQNVTLPSAQNGSWNEYTTKEHIDSSKPIEIVDGVKRHLLKLTIHDATIHTRYNSSENKYNTLVFSYSVESLDKESFGASLAFEGHFGNMVYKTQNGTGFASTLYPGQRTDSTFTINVGKGANQILLVVKDQNTERTLWSIPVTWKVPSLKGSVLTQE